MKAWSITTTNKMSSHVYLWNRTRQLDTDPPPHGPSTFFKDSYHLTRRLTNSSTLGGHTGCVNTVSWNEIGTHLLSGSDDCHLNIYDPSKRKLLFSHHSSHRSNIFSAKFLPNTMDYKCVSCAGLGSVEFSEFTPAGDYLSHKFNCQSSITYQVATTPHDPNEFFTCEERGFVRLFDLRTKSSCLCDGCQKDVLYSFPCGVTSLCVHPLFPNHVALALGDGTTCIMDRRMTICNEGTTTSSGMQLATIDACIAQIKPPCATSQPHKITCVQFNDFGSQLLVNYMEDYLYLFNTAHLGRLVTLSSHDDDDDKRRDRRAPLSSCNGGGRSGVTPPVKRLRLRGDWSDTGPEARPNRDSNDPTSEGISFMNRMSNLFSHWISESLSHGDDHTPTHSDADDSLHLSSEDDDEGEGSNPATPTESLTTAMASCSTESPQYNREDKATPTTEASRTMHFEPVQILERNEGGRDDNDNIDYDRRGINNNCCHDNHPSMMYQGHRNARTMIKQANFWGDQFVMAGSDCGRVFLWDKYTGEIVNVLVADSHVVNCVQPHPHSCVLATSGIDYDIKLWEPMDDSPCELSDLDSIIKRNEEMLQESRNTITVPSSFILHILAYLNQRRRRRTHDEGNNDSSDED